MRTNKSFQKIKSINLPPVELGDVESLFQPALGNSKNNHIKNILDKEDEQHKSEAMVSSSDNDKH